jgi:IclR family pca regulon transcriptional regulator
MGRVLLAALPPADLKAYLAAARIKPLTPRGLGTARELLAVLDTVRAQGWCLLDQELELGLMSVAAPVYDGPTKVVAAVNVSLQAQSVAAKPDPEAFLASVSREIVATAKLISADVSARQ